MEHTAPDKNRSVKKMQDMLCMKSAPLAMSYVPWHRWEELLCEEEALNQGTAFAALIMPFCGKGGGAR